MDKSTSYCIEQLQQLINTFKNEGVDSASIQSALSRVYSDSVNEILKSLWASIKNHTEPAISDNIVPCDFQTSSEI
jgi:hypothetical protein